MTQTLFSVINDFFITKNVGSIYKNTLKKHLQINYSHLYDKIMSDYDNNFSKYIEESDFMSHNWYDDSLIHLKNMNWCFMDVETNDCDKSDDFESCNDCDSCDDCDENNDCKEYEQQIIFELNEIAHKYPNSHFLKSYFDKKQNCESFQKLNFNTFYDLLDFVHKQQLFSVIRYKNILYQDKECTKSDIDKDILYHCIIEIISQIPYDSSYEIICDKINEAAEQILLNNYYILGYDEHKTRNVTIRYFAKNIPLKTVIVNDLFNQYDKLSKFGKDFYILDFILTKYFCCTVNEFLNEYPNAHMFLFGYQLFFNDHYLGDFIKIVKKVYCYNQENKMIYFPLDFNLIDNKKIENKIAIVLHLFLNNYNSSEFIFSALRDAKQHIFLEWQVCSPIQRRNSCFDRKWCHSSSMPSF